MKTQVFFYAAILLTFLAGCSGGKEFRVDAASDDIGTQNVTLFYYADGSFHVENLSAIDGRFSMTGTLSAPAYVEVYSAPGKLLGEFIMEGGDHIEARFSVMNPENISIKGNKDAEMLAEFRADNRKLFDAGDADGLNRAIEEFVRENPKRFVSAVLLTRYFTVAGYEQTATELAALIPDKFRKGGFTEGFEQMLSNDLASDTISINNVRGYSRGDSAIVFNPMGTRLNLLMLTDNDSRGADSVKALVKALRGGSSDAADLRITDMGCDRDTLLWHSSLRSLSEEYPEDMEWMWLNAGVASGGISGAAPSGIPYFILTDSTGKILFRGESATDAKAAYGRIRNNDKKI